MLSQFGYAVVEVIRWVDSFPDCAAGQAEIDDVLEVHMLDYIEEDMFDDEDVHELCLGNRCELVLWCELDGFWYRYVFLFMQPSDVLLRHTGKEAQFWKETVLYDDPWDHEAHSNIDRGTPGVQKADFALVEEDADIGENRLEKASNLVSNPWYQLHHLL